MRRPVHTGEAGGRAPATLRGVRLQTGMSEIKSESVADFTPEPGIPKFVTARPNIRPFIALALWLLLLLVSGAASIRIGLALQSGLWVDEIFSLAMATGHSLEHAPAVADPVLGDYVETPMPQPPSAWRRYAEHVSPAAEPGRVIRAVLLSDTSPPLYYVLLNG